MGLSDDELTYAIIGCSHRVHNHFGFGLLESAYAGALVHVCRSNALVVEREVAVPLYFEGVIVANYRMDLVIEGRVLVEIKACKTLLPNHVKQVLHYLRATDIELGLLLNFSDDLTVKRFTYRNSLKKRFRS